MRYKSSTKGVAEGRFGDGQQTLTDVTCALTTGEYVTGPHSVFQARRDGMVKIYTAAKRAMKADNSKRIVLEDGISTSSLPYQMRQCICNVMFLQMNNTMHDAIKPISIHN